MEPARQDGMEIGVVTNMAALPIFQDPSRNLMLLQTNWSSQLNPVLSLALNSGQILTNQSLTAGKNTINHGLGRNLQGWFIVGQNAPSVIYDQQAGNLNINQTLVLQSSGVCVVNLFVF